jgi:hypothetical protein
LRPGFYCTALPARDVSQVKIEVMNKRLAGALAAYAILAVIAAVVLHGKMLYAVLILFAYFAIRTLIAVKAGR